MKFCCFFLKSSNAFSVSLRNVVKTDIKIQPLQIDLKFTNLNHHKTFINSHSPNNSDKICKHMLIRALLITINLGGVGSCQNI